MEQTAKQSKKRRHSKPKKDEEEKEKGEEPIDEVKKEGQTKCRVFSVSDIHTDHHENWTLLKSWDPLLFDKETDVLLVAGDISTDLNIVRETLVYLKTLFSDVFFLPGNNELRLSKKESFKDSVEKFFAVQKLCEEIGVETNPKTIRGVSIVPLFCWYSPYFDSNFSGSFAYQNQWLDFRKCRWPSDINEDVEGPAKYFLSLNDIQKYPDPVVSFSHFLPRFELLPARMLIKKTLPLVVGFNPLDEQIQKINSAVHVFGHTHINVDKVIDGRRYIQHALGHPHEQKALWKLSWGDYTPKLVFQHPKEEAYCTIM